MTSDIMNKVMADKLKENIVLEIKSIAKQSGINNIIVEFETMKTLFITVPFNTDGELSLSQAFHPDFITDLKKNGYWMSMVYAKKDKGQMMYGMVKKQ